MTVEEWKKKAFIESRVKCQSEWETYFTNLSFPQQKVLADAESRSAVFVGLPSYFSFVSHC